MYIFIKNIYKQLIKMSPILLLKQKPDEIRDYGENVIDGECKEVFEQKLRKFLTPRNKKTLITIYIDRLYFELRNSFIFLKFMTQHRFYNLDILLISHNPLHYINHIKLNSQLRTLIKKVVIYPYNISREHFKILYEIYGSRKYPMIEDFKKAYLDESIIYL